ncbi:MAG TPA: hypothetical protein VGA21_11365 [Cyclobacteriaceae bacterium]|jgi:hypothetical protein
MLKESINLRDETKQDARDRAHKLFLHGIMSYVNGKIDVFELCDRMIRVDSIIRHVPIDQIRKERKDSLKNKILKKFGASDN